MKLPSRLFGRARQGPSELVQPDTPPIQGASIAVAYFAPQTGGDFHAIARVGPGRVLFGLLDVAGKRETCGAILAAARNCFLASGEEVLSAPELNEPEALVELGRRLNLEIMRAAGGVRSCPAFAGCYNQELGTVCYINAGHTPGLLRDPSGIVELPATGLPLGLFSLAPIDARTVGLGSQGLLVVVSRGVVEAEQRHSDFGLAGVTTAIERKLSSANSLSRHILESVRDFMHAPPKHNDVTALVLAREE